MSVLGVSYARVTDCESGKDLGESWIVALNERPADGGDVVLFGFGREVDAKLAKKFLDTLPMDWGLPGDEYERGLAAMGYENEDALMRAACEHLQW